MSVYVVEKADNISLLFNWWVRKVFTFEKFHWNSHAMR